MHRYSEEQKKFIIDNYYGKYSKELADMFNKQFNTNITAKEIKNYRENHKLNSSLTGRFEKGHVTHNKGKKQTEYMCKEAIEKTKATRFKKGNIPQNRREIWEERISKNGYVYIKVMDGCKNDNWELKHRYIYKQHYGEIPNGYNVMFADKNKRNFDIDNLILVSKSEDLIMNNNKLLFSNKELTKTGHLIAKVIDKTNKVKNERL